MTDVLGKELPSVVSLTPQELREKIEVIRSYAMDNPIDLMALDWALIAQRRLAAYEVREYDEESA